MLESTGFQFTLLIPSSGSGIGTVIIEKSLFAFIWKYSKRDQLILLIVTVSLFPLLYLTLELPKRIINDAIDSDTPQIEVLGISFGQVQYLMLLCAIFLIAVLVHGLLKMRINTMKGVLAERLLRRFRYTLIARILRFPAPYFERTSQGELVSMVTSESEPMGGLMGDALAQPVLQAGQMLTILGFLFLQSITFGLAACALIPLQAWLIPKLQRQINLLNKKRVVQVRALAAEIGEGAAGAATLRQNGGWRYRMAMISDRLGRLFLIRFEIYRKKFFMKFLNNFITQLTPFFFYALGGYLAIKGEITVGALVAALAAYKDLASPWKELLTYYNQSQDMSLRWETITAQFAPDGMVDAALFDGTPEKEIPLNGTIELHDVTVLDSNGSPVLEAITLNIPPRSTVAITATGDEDRRALAELLTRELTPSSGKVRIADHDLNSLHQENIATRIGHATAHPVLFQGSIGDNIFVPLKMQPGQFEGGDVLAEAIRAGNSADPLTADWFDPKRAGAASKDELRDWWLELLTAMGSAKPLFLRGLDLKFDPQDHEELAAGIVKLRPAVKQAIQDADLKGVVLGFDPDQYNPALPVADNLLLATPRVPITAEILAQHPDFMQMLADLSLEEDLLRLSVDVVNLLRQIFGVDGTDHPLFRKLGLDVETYSRAVTLIKSQRENTALTAEDKAQLIAVPFSISAEKIGPAFPADVKTRVLDMRRTHAKALQDRTGDLFAPLRPDQAVPGLSVLENALFGKLSDSAGTKADTVRRVVADVLLDNGLMPFVLDLILEVPVSLGGANLSRAYGEPLAVSRAAIKRPDILVLDDVVPSFSEQDRKAMYAGLRRLLPDTTLICLAPGFVDIDAFDMTIEMVGGRILKDAAVQDSSGDSAVSIDLQHKLAALKQTELFAGLDRKQLRLLAFGARWYDAASGSYVFHKNDDPSSGAYVIIEGEADLILPKEDGEDITVATVGPGKLVGELGLIREEPRALDMRAKGDLRCLRIGAEEFLAVVENDAATAYKLLQVVAGYVT